MQKNLIPLLRCPVCQNGDLTIEHVSEKLFIPIEKSEKEFIKKGLLKCVQCNNIFPIYNQITAILTKDMMNESEKKFLAEYDSSQETRIIDYKTISENERHNRMEDFLKQFEYYREESYPDEKSKAWIRNHREYEVKYAHLKEKYIKTILPKITSPPKILLDVGGGQGGALYNFQQYFKPEITLLIDLDDRFAPIANLRSDTINVIRGDATNMPLKNKVCDLTISHGCLEHVDNWPAMLAEFKRTGKETYLNYIPNGTFPWEIGHLSTPLVTWLPKPVARHVCYFWHRLLNNKQYTYHLIDHVLSITNFVPGRKVEKECKRLNMQVTNLFFEYTIEASKATYHHTYGNIVKSLGRHPWVFKKVIGLITALHVEPIIHYYLYHPD